MEDFKDFKFFVRKGGWMVIAGFEITFCMLFFTAPDPLAKAVVGTVAMTLALAAIIGFLPESKVAPAKEADSPRPDLAATRQWVEEMMNKNLSNAMHVNGSTHKFINDRLSRLERLNRQGGYLAFIDDKSVRELGFDYLCGTIHIGEDGTFYRLIDVVMSDGFNGKIVSATIVPAGDARYKANVEANYNHVCSNYSGRGTEMSTEVTVTRQFCEKLIAEYEATLVPQV